MPLLCPLSLCHFIEHLTYKFLSQLLILTSHTFNLKMAVSKLPRLLLAEAHTPSPFPSPTAPFRPSIAVIIGVLTTMFSLTFLLLLYAKHCKRNVGNNSSYGGGNGGFSAAEGRSSGVSRSVVESLPVFRFGSLTGHREGLECVVCLNRFEPAELLRLLPKCKHGFHVECVDIWLEAHSTCPLCRSRVQPEDVLLLIDPKPEPDSPTAENKRACGTTAVSLPLPFVRRISGRHSSAGEKCTSASKAAMNRRSEGGDGTEAVTVIRFERARKDGMLPTESTEMEREEFERRFSHRIIVSGSDGTRERWSDLKPSDLLYLRSEMIITDSGRISASKASGCESGGGKVVNSLRSVSELTGVSRLGSEEAEQTRKGLGFRPKRTASANGNGPSS